MSAHIDILGVPASVRDGVWQCGDSGLLSVLESRAEYVGNSPSIPDIDEHLATDAADILGAIVIKHSDRAHGNDTLIY